MSDPRPVLVLGATGKQGGAALRHLRARGIAVRAVTRKPEGDGGKRLAGLGAEVVRADMNDPASLEAALRGCRAVFSVQNPWEKGQDEAAQGKLVIDAAKRAGVEQVVYASVIRAETSPDLAHFANKVLVEQHLKASGLKWTILRPVYFMDNLSDPESSRFMWATLRHFLGESVKLQMIATDDIGAMAAAAFVEPERWSGQTIDLAGDELSIPEASAVWARVRGEAPPTLPGFLMYGISPLIRVFMSEGWRMFAWYGEASQFTVDIAALKAKAPQLNDFEAFLRLKTG